MNKLVVTAVCFSVVAAGLIIFLVIQDENETPDGVRESLRVGDYIEMDSEVGFRFDSLSKENLLAQLPLYKHSGTASGKETVIYKGTAIECTIYVDSDSNRYLVDDSSGVTYDYVDNIGTEYTLTDSDMDLSKTIDKLVLSEGLLCRYTGNAGGRETVEQCTITSADVVNDLYSVNVCLARGSSYTVTSVFSDGDIICNDDSVREKKEYFLCYVARDCFEYQVPGSLKLVSQESVTDTRETIYGVREVIVETLVYSGESSEGVQTYTYTIVQDKSGVIFSVDSTFINGYFDYVNYTIVSSSVVTLH